MKLYLLESGLQQRMDFRKAIVVEDPKFSMSSLTSQKYTSGTREKLVPKTLKKKIKKRGSSRRILQERKLGYVQGRKASKI